MNSTNRRKFLVGAASLAMTARCWSSVSASEADSGVRLGPAAPFSFDELVARSRELSRQPYEAPRAIAPEVIERIDYEQHGKIKFKSQYALYKDAPGAYPITLFHLGRYFRKPVKMFEVHAGAARQVVYSPGYFSMPQASPARALPANCGFAGFRIQESGERDDWVSQDWLAFLGASYFRAIGALGQYGISARGIAINTTASVPEEFPDFEEFYVTSPRSTGEPVMVYALLNGPSVCGAYSFTCRRDAGVTVDVESVLYVRKEIEQLGVAPLTSMFWYSEYGREPALDWRPEIHDSDGLALWTGSGERIWRPLNNPRRVVTSSFADQGPKGFGLLQRDRAFDHYLDGVNYHLRPSVWVEPLGQWGAGSIVLVEIPTDDEIHDNIVAFWKPAMPVARGADLRFCYRLHWQAKSPHESEEIACVCATRIGRAGEPGKPRPAAGTKFVIEFAGRALNEPGTALAADVTSSRGQVRAVLVERVPHSERWRVQFDLHVQHGDAVELRAFLRNGPHALSETWAYQFHPEPDLALTMHVGRGE